jgi:hypothetical protein
VTSRIPRSAFRILLIGVVGALVAALGGWALERYRLGASDTEAFVHLERETRAQFDDTSRSLQLMTRAGTERPQLVIAAMNEQAAVRALFDAVDDVWEKAGGGPDLAITVNRSDLTQVMLGKTTFAEVAAGGRAQLTGDASVFNKTMSLLEWFDPTFEILPGAKSH